MIKVMNVMMENAIVDNVMDIIIMTVMIDTAMHVMRAATML